MTDAEALDAMHGAVLAWMQEPTADDRERILSLIEVLEKSGRPFIEAVQFGDRPEVRF